MEHQSTDSTQLQIADVRKKIPLRELYVKCKFLTLQHRHDPSEILPQLSVWNLNKGNPYKVRQLIAVLDEFKEQRFIGLSADEILDADIPPVQYMVEKLIPAQGITMVTGTAGCVKHPFL